MKKFIGIREEWMRPLPRLSEMFMIEEKCGKCDCDPCECAKSSEKKSSEKKTSKKEE